MIAIFCNNDTWQMFAQHLSNVSLTLSINQLCLHLKAYVCMLVADILNTCCKLSINLQTLRNENIRRNNNQLCYRFELNNCCKDVK